MQWKAVLFLCSLAPVLSCSSTSCSFAHRLGILECAIADVLSAIKQGARAFSRCGDIAEQLPPEAKRFFPSIDKGFLKVTSKAFEEPVSF